MFERLESVRYKIWTPLPSWAKWAIAIWLILSFDAVRMVWGEKRFVGGYFEALVADFIYLGIPLLAFALGLGAGIKAYDRSHSKIIGWAVGLTAAFVIYMVRVQAESVPGVGWRVQRMQAAHDLAEELN